MALNESRSCGVDDVCVPQAADQESREHLIKTHYMSRVSDLTSQLQMCDSKAVHFHAEVSSQRTTRSVRCSRIHTSAVFVIPLKIKHLNTDAQLFCHLLMCVSVRLTSPDWPAVNQV